MTDTTTKRLWLAAFFAALFGSTVGTVLLFGDEISGHSFRRFVGHQFRNSSEPISSYLLIYPVNWMISLFGMVPGSMLIGVPAIYPARNLIARRALLSAIPTVIYTVLLAT